MSRLSTLFVLGGAGLLLTPVAASAQHIRAFGLPHGRPPLTVPIPAFAGNARLHVSGHLSLATGSERPEVTFQDGVDRRK